MIVGSPTKLNLIPSGVMPVVYINQGDAGYDKEFLIYNGDSPYNVPSGVSATIRGTKADNYGVTEAAEVTTGSNLVTVTITEQMVAAAGENLYELVFVDTDGLRIATINMVWAVKKDALGNAVISDSDLNYVNEALDKIQNAEAMKNQIDTNTTNIEANADGLAAETEARIAADTTLQSNITAEASARATTDNSLQSQINQIVAPSGSAPSAAEVENARIGADGVTYQTLGEAIRTNDTFINDKVNTLSIKTESVYVSGGITNGAFINDNTRLRSGRLVIEAGDRVISDGTYAYFVAIYNSVTQSAYDYVGISGAWTTGTTDLTKYAGKLGYIALRKVGHETENISADASTAQEHIRVEKISALRKSFATLIESYDFEPLIPDDFNYANISTAGAITWLVYEPAYSNAITKKIVYGKFRVVPKTTTVMFRVIAYDNAGNWVENGPWYSKNGTSISTATDEITVGSPFRLMIANVATGQNSAIADLLNDVGIYSIDDDDSVVLPFTGFRINPKLTKVGDGYVCAINPYDHYVTVENGATVFIDANGADTNDGLTVLTPKKTISAALSVANVQTIILAEGTYASGVHFSAGLEVTKPINLIGNGNVVIDSGANSPIMFYRSLFCTGIHFTGGTDSIIVKLGTLDRIVTFYKCKFSGSTRANGMTVQGGTAYVIDCDAYDNAYDGFNYHAYNGIVNHAAEINCRSYGNGRYNLTGADGQSSNATTTHDGSYIMRVNGDYKCCHGGIVADVSSHSANYGCSAGVSTIKDASYPDRMSNYWSRASQMYLYGCASYGSKYDTAVIDGGTIVSDTEYNSAYSA